MDNQDNDHIWKFTVPPGMDADSVYATGTFIVKVEGNGARQVTDEAIMSALVNRGMIPADVATQTGWYKEEDNFFARVLVIHKGMDRINPALDGCLFDMAVAVPNQPHGQTVEVEVTYSTSMKKVFRIEYVPYPVKANVVFEIANDFCNVLNVKRDRKRLDMYWVKTTTPLDELPHWVLVNNLIRDENERKLVVTVKDRDVECFYCRQTDHWTSRCRVKKRIETEERKRVATEKRVARQTEAHRKQFVQREKEQQANLARLRDQTRHEQEVMERQLPRHLDGHANEVRHELTNQRAAMKSYDKQSGDQSQQSPPPPAAPKQRSRQTSRRSSPQKDDKSDPSSLPNSRSNSYTGSQHSRSLSRSIHGSKHSSRQVSRNSSRQVSHHSSRHSSRRGSHCSSRRSSLDSSFHCAQRETKPVAGSPLGPNSGPSYLDDDPDSDATSEWKRDCLDTLSPKVQRKWRVDELTRSVKKIREAQADAEIRQRATDQRQNETSTTKRDAGLRKQKLHNDKQNRDAALAKQHIREKEIEERELLFLAVAQAEYERKMLRENAAEATRGNDHDKEKMLSTQDAEEKATEQDDLEIPEVLNGPPVAETGKDSNSIATNLFNIPDFKTPDESLPQRQRKRKRVCSSRTKRNQTSLNETIDVVGEGSPVTVTPRKSRSMSRGPTSASTPRNKRDASACNNLDEFYSSNPDSELSLITSYLQQSTRTPMGKAKSPADNSSSDKDPKKVKIAGSEDELVWDSFSHGLMTSPAPQPNPLPESVHNNEELQQINTPCLSQKQF